VCRTAPTSSTINHPITSSSTTTAVPERSVGRSPRRSDARRRDDDATTRETPRWHRAWGRTRSKGRDRSSPRWDRPTRRSSEHRCAVRVEWDDYAMEYVKERVL